MAMHIIFLSEAASKKRKNAPYLEQCRSIRDAVFIKGQNVPREIDRDGLDTACAHLLLLDDEQPIGTVRMRKTEAGTKLERIAIIPTYRGRGLGRQLVRTALSFVHGPCYIHAQLSRRHFYEHLGFIVSDPTVFYEASIPHLTMIQKDDGEKGAPPECIITTPS